MMLVSLNVIRQAQALSRLSSSHRLDDLCAAMALKGNARSVFWALASSRGRPLSVSDLVEIVYGDAEDGGPLYAQRCIYRMIYEIRLAMKAVGTQWKITGRHRAGYELVRKRHA